MNPQEMVASAYNQQQLTGRKDADVSFVIPGKWPASGDYKRLVGRRGPLGRCVAEYEDSVLCLFPADKVITFCAPLLPTLTIKGEPPTLTSSIPTSTSSRPAPS